MVVEWSEEAVAVEALRLGRMTEALEAWKAYRLRAGLCDLGLCEHQQRFATCCANRLVGRLLTRALSDPDGDNQYLAHRLEDWIDGNRDLSRPSVTTRANRIEITPGLMVGHPEIDEDHIFLARRISRICDSIQCGEFGAVREGLRHLFQAVDNHFAREEEIMESVGFPGRADHERVHEREREQLAGMSGLVDEVEDGRLDKAELGHQLVALLLDDAIKADLEFKGFLVRRGVLSL